MPGNWTDPLPITQGSLVWGPTLYTPVNNPIPQGPHIKVLIYRGINAPYSPPPGGQQGKLDFSDPTQSGNWPVFGF